MKRFNLTVVFTQFDIKCSAIGQIVAALNSKYDAVILTERRRRGQDENKKYGDNHSVGYPWTYEIYPCILSNKDGDAITEIIRSHNASDKMYVKGIYLQKCTLLKIMAPFWTKNDL